MVSVSSFALLSAFAVLISHAHRLEYRGDYSPVSCNVPTHESVAMTERLPVDWSREVLMPVHVCVLTTSPLADCSQLESSYLELRVFSTRKTKYFHHPFRASRVEGELCFQFSPCRIAKTFAGEPLTGTMVQGHVRLFANSLDDAKPATYAVALRYSSYTVAVDIETTVPRAAKLLSALCRGPSCTVVSVPQQRPTKRWVFTVLDGDQAPRCERKWNGHLRAGMFSVASYRCSATECPTGFIGREQTASPEKKSEVTEEQESEE